jgi:hypothetical protein
VPLKKWLDAVTVDIWPFSLRMAIDIHNAFNGPSACSPEKIFNGQKSRHDRLLDFHTFGCPILILEASSHQGQKDTTVASKRCPNGSKCSQRIHWSMLSQTAHSP